MDGGRTNKKKRQVDSYFLSNKNVIRLYKTWQLILMYISEERAITIQQQTICQICSLWEGLTSRAAEWR